MVESPFGVSKTRRYVSKGGEGELYRTKEVFDLGTIELVDYMGGDETVERVATAGHGRDIFPEKPSRESLFRHLADRRILEPFKSVQMKFLVKSPIDVALTLVYDPSVSVNEYSGRYSVMSDRAHIPSPEDLSHLLNDDVEKAERVHKILSSARERTLEGYKHLLDKDLARELARMGLGTNNETQFFWKIDLPSLVNLYRKGNDHSNAGEYLDSFLETAFQVAPQASDILCDESVSKDNLWLTMPLDDKVVDGPLSLPTWRESETRRVTVPELEEILFERQKVLDHGEFQVVDYMGDDDSFAEAARTSYGKGTRKLQNNRGLIRTLIRDFHTSPIEMAEMAVETKVPMFVDPRQLGRHRTLDKHGFMGYFPLGSQHYFPEDSEFKYQDRKNRQGRGKDMDEEDKLSSKDALSQTFKDELKAVEQLRGEEAPEDLVRLVKGVGFYTKTWRTGDTLNWARFLGLRADPHAQKESREIAYLIEDAQRRHTPLASEAFKNYWFEGVRFSAEQAEAIAQSSIVRDLGEDLTFYEKAGLTIPVDKEDLSEGMKLTREGESLQKNLRKLINE